jgi:Radical SAM ThiC family
MKYLQNLNEFAELYTLGELTHRAWKSDVQVMIEGPHQFWGHRNSGKRNSGQFWGQFWGHNTN